MTPMQNLLVIQPMQWAALPELHETPPLDASDHACMVEIRDALARHGKLGRFALHLAHRHFDLAAGEILIERSDPDGRTQHVSVGTMEQAGEAVPTTWLLDTPPDTLMTAGAYCVCWSADGDGCQRHVKSENPGIGQLKEEAIRDKRIAEERAAYQRGGPVAGHDFERER